MNESDFQDQVLDLARIYHWMAYHTWSSKHSAAGFPDVVLARPPRLIFAELKSETGKVTDAQQAWLAALRACDVSAYLWRPGDLPAIADILR